MKITLTKTLIILKELVHQAIKNEDFRALLEISKAMSDISKEITAFTKSITVEEDKIS